MQLRPRTSQTNELACRLRNMVKSIECGTLELRSFAAELGNDVDYRAEIFKRFASSNWPRKKYVLTANEALRPSVRSRATAAV